MRGVSVTVCGGTRLGEAARGMAQPSDTGGVTQPYFSCVFTRLLKVASASLRLKDFLDLPAFLQMRPCRRKEKEPGEGLGSN